MPDLTQEETKVMVNDLNKKIEVLTAQLQNTVKESELNAKDLLTKLESEKTSASTTQAEKQKLEERISNLSRQLEGVETAKKLAIEESQKKTFEEMELLKKNNSELSTKMQHLKIQTDLMKSINAAEPFNAEQVFQLIKDRAELAEGDKVLIRSNKDGKEILLDPNDYIKSMKESNEHLNLFKSNMKGGFNTSRSKPSDADIANLPYQDFVQYVKDQKAKK